MKDLLAWCRVGVALLVAATWALVAGAQAPPSTDVYLARLSEDGEALVTVANLTKREGYDNQPYFLPDGKGLVYTSMRGEQTDIYRYDFSSEQAGVVRETAESEYSPTPIPGEEALSVVRVEADGTQRLWRVPLDGGEPDLLLPDVAPVGYHAWGDDGQLVLFVLGEPHTLQLAKRGPGKGKQVAADIGRALHRIPGERAFSFVHKTGEAWWVKRLEMGSGKIAPLVKTLPEREDLTWSPDGALWMADGSKLYRWRPGGGESFEEFADLAFLRVGAITRLAFSPDGKALALVAERSAAARPGAKEAKPEPDSEADRDSETESESKPDPDPEGR